MNRIKAFYFCYFGAMAALMPFLVLYYEQIGLSGRQIAVLAALPPLMNLFAAALWNGVADAFNQHKRLQMVAIAGAIGMALLVSQFKGFGQLTGAVALWAIFTAPIMPLADNAALNLLHGRKHLYGRLRLWGAVGWGLMAPISGLLVERFGLSWTFYAYAAILGGGIMAIWRLPLDSVQMGTPFWQGLTSFVRNRAWLIFLLSVFIAGVGSGVINSYLFLYMQSLGASSTLMGIALTVATVSELTVFATSDRLLRWLGVRWLLVLAFGAVIVRMFAYAAISQPVLVLPVQLLHGLTFSAMWVAGVAYADRIAPAGLGAAAQGQFAGVSMGLASATGAFIGGFLFESLGLRTTFAVLGRAIILAYLVLGGVLLASHYRTRKLAPVIEH
ncbi:MAG: MFS transporter [Caldilineaceae bacterium]|nr:MFS transporter [Caldilineaceae bacterium]